MKIVRRMETCIHAHFVTDGSLLTAAQRQQSKNEIASLLRRDGRVLGGHFEAARDDQRLSVVLDCILLPETMERIQAHLEKTIGDVPDSRLMQRKVDFE